MVFQFFDDDELDDYQRELRNRRCLDDGQRCKDCDDEPCYYLSMDPDQVSLLLSRYDRVEELKEERLERDAPIVAGIRYFLSAVRVPIHYHHIHSSIQTRGLAKDRTAASILWLLKGNSDIFRHTGNLNFTLR